MSYVSVGTLKTYLGISESTDDVLLNMVVDNATAAINTYCRRSFSSDATSTRYYDAVGSHIRGNTLYIDDADLCAITTITNGDSVVVASDEYVTLPRNDAPYYAIRLLASSGKTWTYTTDWEAAISIVGNWAYSTSPPDDIVQACLRHAAYMYKQKDAQVFDTTAIPDAGVIQIPAGIPADVKMLLNPYRRLI